MAQRRMFNKSITNSSKFLKMPMSSRLLYYDLGMNADDDGFVEHFMVLRMTGATQQDLGVLEINGLVKIFDDNVLWIRDWKENNYIRNDRYVPSKYLSVYSLETIGIPMVDTGKDSIGKISIEEKEIDKEKEKERFKKPTVEEIAEYCKERNNGIDAQYFWDSYNAKDWMIGKQKMKNWKSCIHTWERNKKKGLYTAQQKEIIEPDWFNKDVENKQMTDEDLQELDDLLKNMN